MEMNSMTLFTMLALTAVSITTLLLSEKSSSPHNLPQLQRRLRIAGFFDDPKTVISRVPQPTKPIILDNPQTHYPLRDISKMKLGSLSKTALKEWMRHRYSDMSSCMDFKCTNDTALCDNLFETNYNALDGKPPCCTHILRDMLHVFDEHMVTLGLNYFVGFGTLLGLVRPPGRVIPWTIDNDISLESEQTLRAIGTLWDVDATGLKLIYPWFPRMCITSQFAGGKLQKWEIPTPRDKATSAPVWFPDRGFPYLDLYFGSVEMGNDDTWGGEYWGCRHLMKDVFPTKRSYVYQGQFALNFPANPEALLARYYGLDWIVPKTDNSQHGEPRKICQVNYGLEERPS